ncbi:hypothetical protein Zm00014a_012099 [Zea mays]|uniref:Uncharacterized protein n=1 Tax=Zea mays TaxID=4577 RepID=A0A3L6FPZ3_MAIZE|nr:hypothetical protein Zm00014a_012099 [Zea mays]
MSISTFYRFNNLGCGSGRKDGRCSSGQGNGGHGCAQGSYIDVEGARDK